MPAWPGTLPPALARGWSAELPDGARRTAMDAGPAKTRLDSDAAVQRETLQFRLTAAQLATLDSFFRVDCKKGALAFTYTHPIWGALGAVKFAGAPSIQDAKPRYLATVRVEFSR